jgi:hypothetical protein
VELFCRQHWNKVPDSFGSRADNLDPVIAAEPPLECGIRKVGSAIPKARGGTSESDRQAHHSRCIVEGAIANIRRCCRRTDQDESRQHRWIPGVMKVRVTLETPANTGQFR